MPTLPAAAGTLYYRDEGAGAGVILVHGSFSTGGQWRELAARLAGRYRVLAPDLYGYGRSSDWPADRTLAMADETALVLAMAELTTGPLHLVGHSYGGALVLSAALSLGPRLASMTLIEPVLFNLLRQAGDAEAWAEIEVVRDTYLRYLRAGDFERAAVNFTRFWMGEGAWQNIPADRQAKIIAAMPKFRAEVEMVYDEPTPLAAYAAITAPTLVMCSTHTRLAARKLAVLLHQALPNTEFTEIAGAGHLAPITHSEPVNAAIAAHIDRHATGPGRAA